MPQPSAFDDLASLGPLQLQSTAPKPTSPRIAAPQPEKQIGAFNGLIQTQWQSLRSTEPTPSNSSKSSPITSTSSTAPNYAASSSSKSKSVDALLEQNIDKFATSFSSSSPNASQTKSTPTPPKEPQRRTSNAQGKPQHQRTTSESSQLSDFGAFVSVSAFDDPLSSSLSPVDIRDLEDELGLQAPMVATPTHGASANSTSTPSASILNLGSNPLDDPVPNFPSLQPRPVSRSSVSTSSSRSTAPRSIQDSKGNSTLSFFDQFASDARERSNASRNLVLNELLIHEDDPLYFLKDQQTTTSNSNNSQHNDADKEAQEKGLPHTPSTAATITGPALLSPTPLSPPPAPPPKSPHYTLTRPGAVHPFPPLNAKPPPAQTTLQPSSTSSSTEAIARAITHSPPPPLEGQNSYIDPLFDIQHDVDHEYFRGPSPADPHRPVGQHSPSAPHTTGLAILNLHHASGHHDPHVRQSSLLVPGAKLAAPVTSSTDAVGNVDSSPDLGRAEWRGKGQFSTSSPQVDEDGEELLESYHDDDVQKDSTRPGLIPIPLGRTASHSSLSGSLTTLPGKWMSSFLRGGPQGGGHGGQARPALESIFSQSAGEASSPPAAQASPELHGWRTSHPQHTQTLPIPRMQPAFSHSSAFTPSLLSNPSASSLEHPGGSGIGGGSAISTAPNPFAPHMYIPPSGAPGFAGEIYGWDKGFSEELEAERRKETQSVPPEPTSGNTTTNTSKVDAGTGSNSESGSRERRTRERDSDSHREFNGRSSHSGSGGGGWGSGFGFGFGSVRNKSVSISSNAGGGAKTRSGDARAVSEGDSRSFDSGQSTRYGQRKGPVRDLTSEDDFGSRKLGARDKENRVKEDSGMGDFIERRAGQVELVGRREASAPVLTPELAGKIRSQLPALARLPKSWTLLYSLDQHGISLNTLYNRCEAHATRRQGHGEILVNKAVMLLVVKDADGAIFGAWLAEGIRYNKAGKGYSGGGESFLWTHMNDTLTVYKCTGRNNYISLCEPECISFGGGDGHYGLYLDDTLFDGSSAPCPTFENEPLCSPGLKKGASVAFECVGLEVWGLGP